MKRFFFLLLAAVLLLGFAGCNMEGSLSTDEISALRGEYPICVGNPPGLAMKAFSFEEVVNMSETIVYAEILTTPEVIEKNLSTGIPELDAKREANGIPNKTSFYTYPVRITEDTEGIFNNGDIIGLSVNEMFEPYYPSFSPGDKIAVAVGQYEGDLYNYIAEGVYYVTDDGYILSAFSEKGQTVRSGKHVHSLMREFKDYKKKAK